jgi:CDGSH-type Zn-finger protein
LLQFGKRLTASPKIAHRWRITPSLHRIIVFRPSELAAKVVIATVFSRNMRPLSDFDDNRFITFRGEFQMPEPTIAQKSPYPVAVEAGKSYYWCSCGRSVGQPFCDGSHKGSGFTPVKFEATESKTVYFCGCKHSANPVFCDGSHAKL